jgi:hypothetical protein
MLYCYWHKQVHEFTLQLVSEGHFLEPKNALELFLLYKTRLDVSFSPADLQKNLAVLMNRKRQEPPVLVCKTEDVRFGYQAI